MCNGGARSDGARFIAADDSHPSWAGYAFQDGRGPGDVPDDVAGVYVLGRQLGDRVVPLHIGEAVDIRTRLALHEAEDGALMAQADRVYWLRQPNARLREHIESILIDRYDPPANRGAPTEEAALALLATDGGNGQRLHAGGRAPERGRLPDGRRLWTIGG